MRFIAVVTCFLAFAALALSGCTTQSGGGAVATPCAPSGACPGNLVCVNSFCVVSQAAATDTAPAAADTSSQPDASSGADLPQVPDVPATAKDAAEVPDVAPADVLVQPADVIAQPADVSSKPDLPAAGPMTIAEIQSGSSSINCANPSGTITTFAGVQLEPVVVVGPSFNVGTTVKSQAFFVAPASGTMDGTYAGIQVLVYNGTVPVAPGDVLAMTGDIKEFYCMTEIAVDAAAIQVTGKVAPPIATQVQIGMLLPASAEPYEDVLIQINDVYVVSPNTLGTDGKTHGECSIGGAPGEAVLFLAPGSSFTQKDPASGQIVTKFMSGQHFTSVTGVLNYSFGEWLLRPRSDADLVN